MGILSRIFSPAVAKAAEDGYREGPYVLSGGTLPAGTPWNFWQLGQDLQPSGSSAMIEACISAYAQTAAMCPGDHWKLNAQGGRDRVTTSALSRILRRPNDYQSMSDFLLNAVREMYAEGEFFALALRNVRSEISELHLMRTRECRAIVGADGSIFYELGGNEIIDRRFNGQRLVVPARDVLHSRLHTSRHPLKGESPMMAAALDVAAGNAALQQQITFFTNQSRPSYVLTSEEKLTKEQVLDLRALWEAQTRGSGAGGTPILPRGMKVAPLGSTAKDAELAETMKMGREAVALVYRVPLQVLGLGGTTFASTEALMQSWIAQGLGFCLNHIEEAFGLTFGLYGMPVEYVEFNTDALLRSAFKDRMEGLSKAVLSGVMAPDEARAREELAVVPGGHGAMPRVQQQVVPLDWHEKQAEAAKIAAEQPVPQLPPPDPEGTDQEPEDDEERSNPEAIIRRLNDLSRLL